MSLKLHVTPANGTPYERPLEGEKMIIGRASSSDLALNDPFLSRHHAQLRQDGDHWVVEDLGSRNGTLLNDIVIRQPTALQPGDVIRVSGSSLAVIGEGGAPPPPAPTHPTTDHGATVFRSASELLSALTDAQSDDDANEEELRRQTERLKLFNEIHDALGRPISSQELLGLILERAFEHLSPEQGVIFLGDSDDNYHRAARMPAENPEEIPLSQSLIQEVCENGQAALVLDVETDERFSASKSIIVSGVRSMIAAPLIDGDHALGMIVLSSKAHVRQFSEDDLEVLVSMASIAAMKIRNTSLLEEAEQRRRLESELSLARRIQESLLPTAVPELEGWELLADNIPSRGVSGDYYNVVTRSTLPSDNRLSDTAAADASSATNAAANGPDHNEVIIFLADVSGKGIPAALLTASIEALSAGPLEDGRPVSQVATLLNRRLYDRSPPEKYATAFFGAIDIESGTLRRTNAGHNPAFLIRTDGSSEHLASTGMPVGMMRGTTYEESAHELAPGDLLAVYSDGITEAENPDDEEYGEERLEQILTENRHLPLAELLDVVNTDLTTFVDGVTPADDRTLVLARRHT